MITSRLKERKGSTCSHLIPISLSPLGGMFFSLPGHYPGSMDVPAFPFSGQLALVIGPHAVQAQMLDLAARLAVGGPLRVLDCGNRFNVYPVARAIRSRTAGLQAALERIHLARAFTCYQVLTLLEEAPDEGVPTLVLDLLATFYDEDVKLPESQRLLRRCLLQLRRLCRSAPLIVSAQPPKPIISAERAVLLDSLRQAAQVLWEAEPAPLPPGATQADLWALEEPQDSPSIPRPLPPDSGGKGNNFSLVFALLAGQKPAIEISPSPDTGEG